MFYNAAIIVGALISDDVKVLAFAVVIGALLHLLVQVPALRLVGMRWQPIYDWKDRAVREVGRLMGPRVIGLAAFQLNFIIATFFASIVERRRDLRRQLRLAHRDDAARCCSAWRSRRRSSRAWRSRPRASRASCRDTLSRSLRLILYLTIPASVGLMILALPITAFLLRGGAFDLDVDGPRRRRARVLRLALFAHSGIEILSRGFYAHERHAHARRLRRRLDGDQPRAVAHPRLAVRHQRARRCRCQSRPSSSSRCCFARLFNAYRNSTPPASPDRCSAPASQLC